jgi:hypothetical protein
VVPRLGVFSKVGVAAARSASLRYCIELVVSMQNYVSHEPIEGTVVDERKSLYIQLGCVYSSGIFV